MRQFREFIYTRDTERNEVFIIRFVRLVHSMLDAITETLIDDRDVRETHEIYAIVFDDVTNLRASVTAYEQLLLQEDSDLD